MNVSLQNKLSEVVGSNNIAYLLVDNTDFSVTGYKVMKNYSGSSLLRCAKIKYDGKIKLVYLIDGYKPLSYMVTRLSVKELNAVILNLVQRATEIKANGFFKAENLELDFDKVFVDPTDYSVRLIYFPVSVEVFSKEAGFENQFRVALINLFNSYPVFTAPQFQRLCSDLANGTITLYDISKKLQANGHIGNVSNQHQNADVAHQANEYNYINPQPISGESEPQIEYNGAVQSGVAVPQPAMHEQVYNYSPAYIVAGNGQVQPAVQPMVQPAVQPAPQVGIPVVPQSTPVVPYIQPTAAVQPKLTITAINTPVQTVMTVTEPEYLIGKNPNLVNGAVIHNPAISRVHCKVSYINGQYYITDMGSANGTFVNQIRLDKHERVELNNGDYIKLANSDFIVSY